MDRLLQMDKQKYLRKCVRKWNGFWRVADAVNAAPDGKVIDPRNGGS